MADPTFLVTDFLDLLVDPTTGDVVLDTDLHFSTGLTGMAQTCKITLQMWMGDWFLNTDLGVPYLQSILGQKFNEAVMAGIFRDVLLAIPGVIAVASLTVAFDPVKRLLSVTFAVQCAFGITTTQTVTNGGQS